MLQKQITAWVATYVGEASKASSLEQERVAIILFSNLNQRFSGYFDPMNMYFYFKKTNLLGRISDVLAEAKILVSDRE